MSEPTELESALAHWLARRRYGPGIDMGGADNPTPQEWADARMFAREGRRGVLAAARAEGRAEGAREEREACLAIIEGRRVSRWLMQVEEVARNCTLDEAAAAIRARG
jgi:hypothetical protein